jgi:hypothetical protein
VEQGLCIDAEFFAQLTHQGLHVAFTGSYLAAREFHSAGHVFACRTFRVSTRPRASNSAAAPRAAAAGLFHASAFDFEHAVTVLELLSLPHGHGWLRPTLGAARTGRCTGCGIGGGAWRAPGGGGASVAALHRHRTELQSRSGLHVAPSARD